MFEFLFPGDGIMAVDLCLSGDAVGLPFAAPTVWMGGLAGFFIPRRCRGVAMGCPFGAAGLPSRVV